MKWILILMLTLASIGYSGSIVGSALKSDEFVILEETPKGYLIETDRGIKGWIIMKGTVSKNVLNDKYFVSHDISIWGTDQGAGGGDPDSLNTPNLKIANPKKSEAWAPPKNKYGHEGQLILESWDSFGRHTELFEYTTSFQIKRWQYLDGKLIDYTEIKNY